MKKKTIVIGIVLLVVTVFLTWRFIRPMNIFVVSEKFERPMETTQIPAPLRTLSAKECATCHREFYDEWATTIHSQAWTDPYFQVDWKFDGSQQVCKNCHIPLDRQQEHKVLGFRDKEKWDPILAPNPDFDPELQHEGVTCAVCHLQEGKILGPYGSKNAPHPVAPMKDPNQVCARCHVVGGERWDTFFRFPPCGTVAEIRDSADVELSERDLDRLRRLAPPDTTTGIDDKERTGPTGDAQGQHLNVRGKSGEAVLEGTALNCIQCHMPVVERPLIPGGQMRTTRRHLWRGGHDPAMVKSALKAELREEPADSPGKRRYVLTLVNVGAAHYLPTGTPDRHLTATLRLLDADGNTLEEERHILKRNILWRPFIIDLKDTRLPRWQPRTYTLEFAGNGKPAAVEAVVRYHLLEEKRRKQIGYENKEPISYEVFSQRILLKD